MPRSRIGSTDPVERLSGKLLYSAAAVVERIKPSSLYNFVSPKEIFLWKQERSLLLARLNLSAYTLYKQDDFLSVLFYREELLAAHLKRPEIAGFLRALGYPSKDDLCGRLASLKERYSIRDYPHEIGVFLGYPLADVWGFINNKGQNYKACKYWKVYGDVQQSECLFAQIDHAKTKAVALLAGA